MGRDVDGQLSRVLHETFDAIERAVQAYRLEPVVEAVGRVNFVGRGIARVSGLAEVRAREVIQFPGNALGMAFNLDPEEVGIVLLDRSEGLSAGSEVRRTGRVLDVPVGKALLGRVVDAVGRSIDGKAPPKTGERLPIERPAPGIMDRAPVTVPLQTGLKVVDALIPVGRGQRELILGDRQTGKTAIALDAMINQRDTEVLCVYCAIGQRMSAVAKLVDDLANYGILEKTIVVATSEEDPPGLQFVTPYSAMSMGEYFRDRGRDVLVVLDDLTRHAWAYRELSLLLRRPPGREAFPGDIFFIHSRLLERSTHLNDELGGGSLTTLPIVETEAQNISAYIPTNLISITDGQIYLSPDLFRKGILPAIEVGRSVSRVGGKTQLPAYRAVAGDLKLAYSQFQELEAFARFGTRLEEETRKSLERGRRVREVLKQAQYEPLPVPQQIAALVSINQGLFDEVPIDRVAVLETEVRNAVAEQLPELCERIQSGEPLEDDDRRSIVKVARNVIDANRKSPPRDDFEEHESETEHRFEDDTGDSQVKEHSDADDREPEA